MARVLLGIALVVGLWFPLEEWAGHIAANPAAAYALSFPLLLLAAARATPPTEPAPREGLAWIALAMAIEVVAFGGDVARLGRAAIPLGVIGYLRFTGSAALAPAALAFFIVPVPHALVAFSPLEEVWRSLAESLLGPAGPALRLTSWDSGIRLVALFAGLGWYADARSGGSWRGALRRGAQLAMLGLPVQLAATIVAVALARMGAVGSARAFLTHGVWMICGLGIVLAIEVQQRREVPARV